jgi:hypothetical protein
MPAERAKALLEKLTRDLHE